MPSFRLRMWRGTFTPIGAPMTSACGTCFLCTTIWKKDSSFQSFPCIPTYMPLHLSLQGSLCVPICTTFFHSPRLFLYVNLHNIFPLSKAVCVCQAAQHCLIIQGSLCKLICTTISHFQMLSMYASLQIIYPRISVHINLYNIASLFRCISNK